MKYKVGDKVRVREDLEVDDVYGDYHINREMAELKGKVVTIEDVKWAYIYIEECDYVWTAEMFSGLAEEPRNLIPLIAKELGVEIGEKIKISNSPYVYKVTEDGLIGIEADDIHDVNYTFSQLINEIKKHIKKLPKKPKLTEAERIILESLPKSYKYIVRDYCGELYAYENKPKKDGDIWIRVDTGYSYSTLNLFQHLFQFIKWEDKEPYKIQELLEGELNEENIL